MAWFPVVSIMFVFTLQRRRELDAELERSQAERKTLLARLQVLFSSPADMLLSP
jgi:hypothetical protein